MNDTEDQLRETFARQAELAPSGDDLVATSMQRGRSRIRRRRGMATLSLAGALGIGLAVGAPIVQGGDGSQAFAVEQHGANLTVKIYRFDDAAGLQQQLADHGVTAKVVYTPKGQGCKLPWFTPSHRSGQVVQTITPQDFKQGYSLTIRPSELATHDTLVIVNADLNPDRRAVNGLPKPHAQYGESSGSIDSSGKPHAVSARGISVAVAQGNVPNCQLVDD